MNEAQSIDLSQEVGRPVADTETAAGVGRVTLLEVLAEDTKYISPNRSNRSTPPSNVDPDDQ
jgi:hypothetical protein